MVYGGVRIVISLAGLFLAQTNHSALGATAFASDALEEIQQAEPPAPSPEPASPAPESPPPSRDILPAISESSAEGVAAEVSTAPATEVSAPEAVAESIDDSAAEAAVEPPSLPPPPAYSPPPPPYPSPPPPPVIAPGTAGCLGGQLSCIRVFGPNGMRYLQVKSSTFRHHATAGYASRFDAGRGINQLITLGLGEKQIIGSPEIDQLGTNGEDYLLIPICDEGPSYNSRKQIKQSHGKAKRVELRCKR